MLLLTKSTLFFVNLLHSYRTEPNSKSQVLAKVKQWSTRVQDEHVTAGACEGSPSATSSMPTIVSLTVLSSSMQSLAATTVADEIEYNIKTADEDTPHGGFGEDSDDSLKCEDIVKVRAGKQVSNIQLTVFNVDALTLLPTGCCCRADSSATHTNGWPGRAKTEAL